MVPKFELPFEGKPHVALDDAIHQVKQYHHVKRILNTHSKVLIDQGQRFNEMAQTVADLEFKLFQIHTKPIHC